MSKIGQAIQEMEDMGLEPTQENLKYYVKQKKQRSAKDVTPKKDDGYKEKIKKV